MVSIKYFYFVIVNITTHEIKNILIFKLGKYLKNTWVKCFIFWVIAKVWHQIKVNADCDWLELVAASTDTLRWICYTDEM